MTQAPHEQEKADGPAWLELGDKGAARWSGVLELRGRLECDKVSVVCISVEGCVVVGKCSCGAGYELILWEFN